VKQQKRVRSLSARNICKMMQYSHPVLFAREVESITTGSSLSGRGPAVEILRAS